MGWVGNINHADKDSKTANSASYFPHSHTFTSKRLWRSRFLKKKPRPDSDVKSLGLSVRASESLAGTFTDSATDPKNCTRIKRPLCGLERRTRAAFMSTSDCNKQTPQQHFHSSQRSRCSAENYTAVHRWKSFYVNKNMFECFLLLSLSWRLDRSDEFSGSHRSQLPVQWLSPPPPRWNQCSCCIKTPDSVRPSFLIDNRIDETPGSSTVCLSLAHCLTDLILSQKRVIF